MNLRPAGLCLCVLDLGVARPMGERRGREKEKESQKSGMKEVKQMQRKWGSYPENRCWRLELLFFFTHFLLLSSFPLPNQPCNYSYPQNGDSLLFLSPTAKWQANPANVHSQPHSQAVRPHRYVPATGSTSRSKPEQHGELFIQSHTESHMTKTE